MSDDVDEDMIDDRDAMDEYEYVAEQMLDDMEVHEKDNDLR